MEQPSENINQSTPSTSGYKPALTVNVDIKDIPSCSVTPKVAQTPHVSTNIFVAGIPSYWDDEALRKKYIEFGEIVSTRVVKNRHFGFVMFRKAEAAHAAINATHLTRPENNCATLLHVSIAMHDEGVDDLPNERIFVRGLPQWATKEHIKQSFLPYGNIVDCAVLMNPLGQCKGSGFVQFTTVEEATCAVNAAERIRVDSWDSSLEIKFSETPEVRQQRQERNRNRQRNWANSPKYKHNGNTPSVLPSPFPLYPQPLPVMHSPQGFPMMRAMPFPIMYPPSSAASVVGTAAPPSQVQGTPRIVYPQSVMTPVPGPMSFYQPPTMIMVAANPVPQKGDLHFSGGPLTEDLVRTLLQPYGGVEQVLILDNDGGIAARMNETNKHPFIAQQLNGTLFSTGQVLAAGLYA